MRARPSGWIAIAIALMTGLSGCSPEVSKDGLIRVDIDRKNPRPFLQYYFASFASTSLDPFSDSLLVEDDGSFYIDFEALKSSDRSAASLINAASDGVLTWEELSPFFQKTYYARRNAPVSLALLKSESDFPAGDSLFVLSVTGVMTTTTRNVAIARSSIRNALMSYRASGDRLLYPKGTVIIASHSLDDTDLEFTAMRKREDDFWDYFVYDADGLLTDSTQTDPKHLNAPTQCVGCHLGTRLFEPERSFPAAARPGPDGPRGVHVDPVLRIGSAVRYLDEHRKRSDGILGLYGTIFVSELLVSRREGTLSDVDAALLDTLGL